MSVDDVRAGFLRLAETVVPEPDPYGRLVRRRKRRRRTGFAGLSGVVAMVLAGGVAGAPYLAGGWSARPPADGYAIDSDWVRQLIASPARGNLAGDHGFIAAVERAFDRGRDETGMDRSLAEVTVLFAHEIDNTRTVAVAFHSADRAALVVKSGRNGASASEIVKAGGLSNARVMPFLTFADHRDEPSADPVTHFSVGLAPSGCEVSTSDSATIAPDGSVQRRWRSEPTASYVVREGDHRAATREVWRVTCAGVVRHEAPARRVDEITTGAGGVDTGGARGTVDRAVAEAAAATWDELTSTTRLAGGSPSVLWGGSIPGKSTGTPAVLVGPSTDHGPVVLQLGDRRDMLVALGGPQAAGRPVEVETMAASRAEWSLAATGVTVGDLVAVQVPEREAAHAVLGDRVFVLAPSAAARVEAVADGGRVVAEAATADGAALLTLPLPANVTLRALDGDGRAIASVSFAEPDTELRLFGERLISNW